MELGNAGKGSVQSSVESTGNGSLVEADSDQSQHKVNDNIFIKSSVCGYRNEIILPYFIYAAGQSQ